MSDTDATEIGEIERELERRTRMIRLLQVVAVAANEAASVEAALQTCVEQVCAHSGWQVGVAWTVGHGAELTYAGVWYPTDPQRYPRFRAQTTEARFAAGAGLPGRVLKSGQPTWIADVGADAAFV